MELTHREAWGDTLAFPAPFRVLGDLTLSGGIGLNYSCTRNSYKFLSKVNLARKKVNLSLTVKGSAPLTIIDIR